MKKLRRLLKRYVASEIANHNKGAQMPEDYAEIEKELSKRKAALWRQLELLQTHALKNVTRLIEEDAPHKLEPDETAHVQIARRRDLFNLQKELQQ